MSWRTLGLFLLCLAAFVACMTKCLFKAHSLAQASDEPSHEAEEPSYVSEDTSTNEQEVSNTVPTSTTLEPEVITKPPEASPGTIAYDAALLAYKNENFEDYEKFLFEVSRLLNGLPYANRRQKLVIWLPNMRWR